MGVTTSVRTGATLSHGERRRNLQLKGFRLQVQAPQHSLATGAAGCF